MLTPITSREMLAPRPASSHILNRPAETLPSRSDGTNVVQMRDRLIQAERNGEVVKLTGSRSVSSPGGDAA